MILMTSIGKKTNTKPKAKSIKILKIKDDFFLTSIIKSANCKKGWFGL